MKVMNTYFMKENKQKATYQKKDNTNGGPPWTPERYGEIDLCLARRQWTNSITNVESVPMTNINTDHKAIHVKIKQKLKAREESEQDITLKGIKPTKEGQTKEEAIDNYNKKIQAICRRKMESRRSRHRRHIQMHHRSRTRSIRRTNKEAKKKRLRLQTKTNFRKKEKSTGRKRPRTVQEDHQRTKEESEKHQT